MDFANLHSGRNSQTKSSMFNPRYVDIHVIKKNRKLFGFRSLNKSVNRSMPL
jgi:hypothetical protein